jgi:hypothetical protein
MVGIMSYKCDHCGTIPTEGLRFKCTTCADFDLCPLCIANAKRRHMHDTFRVSFVADTVSVTSSAAPVPPRPVSTAAPWAHAPWTSAPAAAPWPATPAATRF